MEGRFFKSGVRPKPRMGRAVALLAALSLAPIAAHCGAEAFGSVTLMQNLAGHRYERTTTSPAGQVKSRSLIEVGLLREQGAQVLLPLTIIDFDPDGNPKEPSISTWICSDETTGMIMSILGVVGTPKEVGLSLAISGDSIVYRMDAETLPDIHLELDARKRFLSMLGGRTRLSVTERRAGPLDAASDRSDHPDSFVVTSRIEIRASALGIRLKTLRFRSREVIQPGFGLIEQRLDRRDGTTIELRLVPPKASGASRTEPPPAVGPSGGPVSG